MSKPTDPEIIMGFGRYKGSRLRELPDGYARGLASSLPGNTKHHRLIKRTLREIIDARAHEYCAYARYCKSQKRKRGNHE